MRILIINYVMDENSGVLAWQAGVARRIALLSEFVLVLTDRIGTYMPAENMIVEQLPRRPIGVPRRAGGAWLMNLPVYKLCRRFRIDVCFVHMAMGWTYLLSPCFKYLGIPVLLWYAHGTVSRQLRMAHRCAARIVTSTPEGFRLPSNKVRVIGQGIDTDLFRIPEPAAERNDLIYVGRISRRKNIELILDVMDCIRKISEDVPIRLRLIGPMLTPDDLTYDAELRSRVWAAGLQEKVEFAGFVPQEHISRCYRTAFLHINVSRTGSMDKTVIESLACGCPVITSNPAFRELLSGCPEFIIKDERPEAIAELALGMHERHGGYDPRALRGLILGKHDMFSYAEKITANLGELMRGA